MNSGELKFWGQPRMHASKQAKPWLILKAFFGNRSKHKTEKIKFLRRPVLNKIFGTNKAAAAGSDPFRRTNYPDSKQASSNSLQKWLLKVIVRA